MTDDFSKTPVSLAELRSERAEDGALWKPRDALIALLRRIDSGEDVDALVVCWRTKHEGGRYTGHFYQAMQDPYVTMGLLGMTAFKMQS